MFTFFNALTNTEPAEFILLSALLILNLISFALMGIDKQRARKGAFRIPEKRLFLFAFLGGSLGAVLGMHLFHHKTRHWYFRYGLPAILICHILLGFVLFYFLSP